MLDKEVVKQMLCNAIDNIPECAEITDCYTEHSLYAPTAYIQVVVRVKDNKKQSLIGFNDVAHKAFGTDMDFLN